MNVLQTLPQSPEYIREQKLKIAQERSAVDCKRRAAKIIAKYNKGELQSYKTVSKAIGLLHSIPRPVLEVNGWKRYTRFAYSVDPEKHQLIIEPCNDVHSNHTLVLCSDGKIKICYNVCTLAGWDAGDIILIVFRGKKTIMVRTKASERERVEERQQDQQEIGKVYHINGCGYFQLLPDCMISKRNGWTSGTRFSCATENGKIVLEESVDGDRKINGLKGLITVSKSICQRAGLHKCDPISVGYEGKKIIIERD